MNSAPPAAVLPASSYNALSRGHLPDRRWDRNPLHPTTSAPKTQLRQGPCLGALLILVIGLKGNITKICLSCLLHQIPEQASLAL